MSNKKHKELLKHLLPLIEFMDNNQYNYFLVAGKDGVCSRYLRGKNDDVSGMITGMAEKTPTVKMLLEESLKNMPEK